MDAAAYLANQGWQGNGHALHHSGRGITKPVHIPQKANVLGLGKKQHDTHADQWWARAFDDTLKGLNTSKNEATGKTERVSLGSSAQALRIARTGGTKRTGQGNLYSNFVKGESLNGTLMPEEKDHPVTQPQSEGPRKQKRGGNDVDLSAVVPKDVKRRKKKRPERERATTE